MKVLVIHPNDPSTDFLKPIYADINEATVVNGGVSKKQVKELIKQHDRIIMLGHGSPSGLFSVGQFYESHGMVIDYSMVPLLKNKECIGIWCNCDVFFKRYELGGLYSGMFISEVSESEICGVPSNQKTINESNDYFAKQLGKVSSQPLDEMFDCIKDKYSLLAETNKIAEYNSNRLFFV